MKKVFLTIVIIISLFSVAVSQTTTDTSISSKKQSGKQVKKAGTTKTGQSKKQHNKTHHHNSTGQLKKGSTPSGGGRSGAGIERSGQGLDQADSTQTRTLKPRVASENAGPGLPAGKGNNRKAGSKNKSKRADKGDSDSTINQ